MSANVFAKKVSGILHYLLRSFESFAVLLLLAGSHVRISCRTYLATKCNNKAHSKQNVSMAANHGIPKGGEPA